MIFDGLSLLIKNIKVFPSFPVVEFLKVIMEVLADWVLLEENYLDCTAVCLEIIIY